MHCSIFYGSDIMLYYHMHIDALCSRGVSEVVYPLVDKNRTTEAVSMTPLHKTLQSFMASAKLSSKRFTCYLLSTIVNMFG